MGYQFLLLNDKTAVAINQLINRDRPFHLNAENGYKRGGAQFMDNRVGVGPRWAMALPWAKFNGDVAATVFQHR